MGSQSSKAEAGEEEVVEDSPKPTEIPVEKKESKIQPPPVEKKSETKPPEKKKEKEVKGGVSRELQLLVVGLDNSGKSTIVSRMKVDEVPSDLPPTPGFQVEKFSKGKVGFTVFDMSGASKYRNLWETNYKNCQCVIFVVDSADKFRIVVARSELENLLAAPDLFGVPLLVFANKNDIPNALNYTAVQDQLGLDEISDRTWHIISSNALSGQGIDEGVDWVINHAKK